LDLVLQRNDNHHTFVFPAFVGACPSEFFVEEGRGVVPENSVNLVCSENITKQESIRLAPETRPVKTEQNSQKTNRKN